MTELDRIVGRRPWVGLVIFVACGLLASVVM